MATTFSQLISGLDDMPNGRMHAVIPDDWMQGRTTYGGLTAALCHEAAKRVANDRPLKAVQVAFVGPSGGDVVISPTVLREGKNTTVVSVDLVGERGCAARCLFTFASPRPSHLSQMDLEIPIEFSPPSGAGPHLPNGAGPSFIQHFDTRLVSGPVPFSGAEKADVYLWLRHRDNEVNQGPYDPTHLLSIGDVPPPAAMGLMRQPAMISSMTWMVEFLSPEPETNDGWFLNRSHAETAINGYSAQAMTLWNSAGEPLLVGRQTIAFFD